MDKIRKTLSACLTEAAGILRRHFTKIQSHEVETKSKHFDLQTIADTEAENAIICRIQNDFPEHSVYAEESGRETKEGASVTWIIDPLDGTCNFRFGIPYCAISIAVEIEGKVRLGAVFNPFQDERFWAEKGKGAYCNDKPICVSKAETLEDALLVAGFPYDRRERMDRYIYFFRTFMMQSQGVLRMGSAALDLCAVACGRVGAYYEESLSRWDWAAGKLIVEEAGGKVTDYRGGDRVFERKELCATNGRLHGAVLGVVGRADAPA